MIPMPKGQPLLHVQDLRVAYPGREFATIGVDYRGQVLPFATPKPTVPAATTANPGRFANALDRLDRPTLDIGKWQDLTLAPRTVARMEGFTECLRNWVPTPNRASPSHLEHRCK